MFVWMSGQKRLAFGILLLLMGVGACSDASSPGAGGTGGGGAGGATAGSSGGSSTAGSAQGGASGTGAPGGGAAGGIGGSPADAGGVSDASADTNADPEGGDPPNECSVRTDVDTYMPNLKKVGKNGVLTFQLLESVPAPPIRGTNTWAFKVAQADGKSVAQGLTAKVDMPDHNHTISVQPDVTFDPATETYEVTPLYYFMPGRWRTVFTVSDGTVGGTPIDSAEFIFCVL